MVDPLDEPLVGMSTRVLIRIGLLLSAAVVPPSSPSSPPQAAMPRERPSAAP